VQIDSDAARLMRIELSQSECTIQGSNTATLIILAYEEQGLFHLLNSISCDIAALLLEKYGKLYVAHVLLVTVLSSTAHEKIINV
jgi:hypothetical protein